MIKRKNDSKSFRRFLVLWGIAYLVATIVFLGVCYLSLTLLSNLNFRHFSGESWRSSNGFEIVGTYLVFSAEVALIPALIVLSLLQDRISKATINVLPAYWVGSTFAAGLIGYLPILIWQQNMSWPSTRISRPESLIHILLPFVSIVFLIALTQGLSLMRYGTWQALKWGFCLIVSLLFLPTAPILLLVSTGILCHQFWTQSDLRKRHVDEPLAPMTI